MKHEHHTGMLVMRAFDHTLCNECRTDIQTPHTPGNVICKTCSEKLELCEVCGQKMFLTEEEHRHLLMEIDDVFCIIYKRHDSDKNKSELYQAFSKGFFAARRVYPRIPDQVQEHELNPAAGRVIPTTEAEEGFTLAQLRNKLRLANKEIDFLKKQLQNTKNI